MSKIRNSSTTTSNTNRQSVPQQHVSSSKQKDLVSAQIMNKKRSALGNISNATGVSTTNGLTLGNNNLNSASNKEVTKKSRIGLQESNITSTLPNGVQPVLKKSDSVSTSKKSAFLTKETAKENFSSILPMPCSFLSNNKKKIDERKSLHQLPECKQAKNNTTNNKPDLNEIKQEAIQKLKQIKVESGLSKPDSDDMDEIELIDDNEDEEVNSNDENDDSEAKSSKEEMAIADLQPIESWEDIDANDTDEFNASDYVNYIFKYYNERENKFTIRDYIKEQPHINKQMRLLLVDWMVEVQQQLEFNHEVLYLSVKLLDMYLNGRKVEKEKLQLLGGAAMFIACKFEERMPPIIDDFIYVSDNAYNRKELIKMEIDILKSVQFDIGIPLSYTFLRRFAKCVKADMKFLTLARYILELSLQDYSFVYIKDSLKACAALFLALKMTVNHENSIKASGKNNQLTVSYANLSSTEWNSTLIHYTGCNLRDFIDLLPSMNNLILTAPNSKYTTIFRKYSHPVFYEVARVSSLSSNEIESLAQSSKIN
jgi:G2/mitotic-specific cyclin-B3